RDPRGGRGGAAPAGRLVRPPHRGDNPMKRAFSFRNQAPPIEPLSAASEAPEPDPAVDKTDRDLAVVPEGGRFGELLVRKQLVSRGAIMEALLQQTGTGKRLGNLLVDAGAITDRQLAETLAEQLNLPL